MVLFVSKGCCKKLKPKYEKVAKMVSNNPNIVLAMIDGNNNDVLNNDVIEFPTIYLFARGKK